MANTSSAVVRREASLTRSEKCSQTLVIVAPSASGLVRCAFVLLGVALVVVCGLLGYLLHRLDEQERWEAHRVALIERDIERLDAAVTFAERRIRLLTGMRDEIVRVNPRISRGDAYRYAELTVEASEKYPTVSPLLLLAVGVVESGLRPDAVSAAEARGMFQIWPATGRHLARTLGWEFTEEMLLDPQKNTEMAALYLDILFAAYNDPGLVLAEYNGGPRNAGLFRAGHSDVAEETRNYVPKVLAVYRRLQSELGISDTVRHALYRDPRRGAKTLVPQNVAARPEVPSVASRRLDE